MTKTPLNYIDIFAGCGGISLGLHNSGWKGLFAIERDSMAFETLKHNLIDERKHFNWPEWLPQKNHDILEVLKNYENKLRGLQGKVDLIVGGPPCQGFSMAGRRKENDKRNNLFEAYISFIDLVKPKALIFENVKGFTIGFRNKNGRGKAFSDMAEERLGEMGYQVKGKIIDFSDLGVPQRRKRFILVGFRKDLKKNPEKFFQEVYENSKIFCKRKGIKQKNTVGDAISDLLRENGEVDCEDTNSFKRGIYGKPSSPYQKLMRIQKMKNPDSHRFPKHNDSTTEKFRYILNKCLKGLTIDKETKQRFNLKKRSIILLSEKSTSPTLTTLPDDYIHYAEPRILTVREYARIQSFDDGFKIKGKYTTGGDRRTQEVPRYTQIGNAIPPLGGEQFGEVLKEILA